MTRKDLLLYIVVMVLTIALDDSGFLIAYSLLEVAEAIRKKGEVE